MEDNQFHNILILIDYLLLDEAIIYIFPDIGYGR
jgi:hypothetical protein